MEITEIYTLIHLFITAFLMIAILLQAKNEVENQAKFNRHLVWIIKLEKRIKILEGKEATND